VADIVFQYGLTADIPIVSDWNGNGSDSVGIYRPSSGVFYLRNTLTSGIADAILNFGVSGGLPVVGP
jgi:hypothetical protein